MRTQGCTVNMDGSALERPIVVLWIAHVAGYPLDFGEQLVVALTSALISVGKACGLRTPWPRPRLSMLISSCMA